MRVLVTGGMGNLGRYTLSELLRRGWTVRCLDLASPETRRRAIHYNGSVEFIWGDIRSQDDVVRSMAEVDVVVHLRHHPAPRP